jgi:hypothetical protein
MGLSPLLDPKNPYIRGDTAGGRGYPHHIGRYRGVVHIFMVYSPLSSDIYYIPIALPTIVSTNIQITNTMKALKGFSMWVYMFGFILETK